MVKNLKEEARQMLGRMKEVNGYMTDGYVYMTKGVWEKDSKAFGGVRNETPVRDIKKAINLEKTRRSIAIFKKIGI